MQDLLSQKNQNAIPRLESERLVLRAWRQDDVAELARINKDPQVMAFAPRTMTEPETKQAILGLQQGLLQNGYGFWACELKAEQKLIGMMGLLNTAFEAFFTPCVEIGWHLDHAHWGKGYATEAARCALRFGFDQLKLAEVVSHTSKSNQKSIAVMKRLGMTHKEGEEFIHPGLRDHAHLKEHILFRLKADEFFAQQSDS